MNKYKDQLIQIGTDTDRQYLLDLQKDPNLAKNVSVVYIYTLVGRSIEYPEKSGNVIYIGEAFRPSEPTGKRFAQHISTTAETGGDSGTIYSLSRYYWNGQCIRLRVFILDENENREDIERRFLRVHVKEFGALPICQGTTGENYKTTDLNALEFSHEIQVLTA
jgi:hypothetical protein